MVDIGSRWGRLQVVGYEMVKHRRMAVCRCDCGAVKVVRHRALVIGDTVSCGCYAKSHCGYANRTHGKAKTPEYRLWSGMITRCENPSDAKKYALYGGRGIRVCERWRASFESFLADMGPRPTAKHTLDRIDVNGNYEPGNCRWATWTEQARNRRNSVWVEYGGERLPLAEVASRTGYDCEALRNRLRLGWTMEKATTAPIRRQEKQELP